MPPCIDTATNHKVGGFLDARTVPRLTERAGLLGTRIGPQPRGVAQPRMETELRKWLPIGLGLILATLFGWLTVRKVDWAATGAALSLANWGLVAVAVPLLLSSVLFRALRWRLILRDHAAARFDRLALAAGVGIGANALLPGKLGEAVGAHALGRLADLSRIQSLGILVITRVVDLLVLFALVLTASLVLAGPTVRAYQRFAFAMILLSGIALLVPMLLHRTWAAGLVQRIRRAAERALGAGPMDFAAKFARGLASAAHVRQLIAFVAGTGLLWLMLSVSLWVVLRAFRIGLAPELVPLVMGLIAASAMLPSAPGNVGTFHYFGIAALGLVGVESGLAAACVITYHALDMISALALGAVCGAMARTPLLLWRTPVSEPVVVRTAPAAGLAAPFDGPSAPVSRPAAVETERAIVAAEET